MITIVRLKVPPKEFYLSNSAAAPDVFIYPDDKWSVNCTFFYISTYVTELKNSLHVF